MTLDCEMDCAAIDCQLMGLTTQCQNRQQQQQGQLQGRQRLRRNQCAICRLFGHWSQDCKSPLVRPNSSPTMLPVVGFVSRGDVVKERPLALMSLILISVYLTCITTELMLLR